MKSEQHTLEDGTPEQHMRFAIERVGKLLPTQGPIDVFIHHNPLHEFEGLPFFEALEKAAELYRALPYLPLESYQKEYQRARITRKDLKQALTQDAQQPETESSDRIKQIEVDSLIVASSLNRTSQIWWRLYEGGDLDKPIVSGEALPLKAAANLSQSWLLSLAGREALNETISNVADVFPNEVNHLETVLEELNSPSLTPVQRYLRELWILALDWIVRSRPEILANSIDNKSIVVPQNGSVDALVNPFLVKISAAFLDQGLAYWSLEYREEGFKSAIGKHLLDSGVMKPWWLGKLSSTAIEKYLHSSPEEILLEHVRQAKIAPCDWERYILQRILSLKGWAGMMRTFAERKEMSPVEVASHKDPLAEFLATKIYLDDIAVKHCDLRKHEVQKASRVTRLEDTLYRRAYHLFRLFQTRNLSLQELKDLNKDERQIFLKCVNRSRKDQRRIWHRAYENHLLNHSCEAIISHNKLDKSTAIPPKAQFVFCIDDREESIRRYLEEFNKDIETFGSAGFFGVDAEYQHGKKMSVPSCPAGVSPSLKIYEHPHHREWLTDRAESLRESTIKLSHRALTGWVVSLLGTVALIPLIWRTLSPRWLTRSIRRLSKHLLHSSTRLDFEREDEGKFTPADVLPVGITVEQMANRVEALFRSIGSIGSIAELVFIVGHGSHSQNNPYRSAYDCGACGGRPGKINARVFALMANKPEVRAVLQSRGVLIPDTTHFIGAFHNTGDDHIDIFDLELVPARLHSAFEQKRLALDQALKVNAFERCRRFANIEVFSPADALEHVDERTHSFFEPRPEYNHATNALCIIGPRNLTKGLFLDRRSFLVSYDPALDKTGEILLKILSPVIPVCSGINLEYFFSTIDNETYGAGTKLPHNITGLLGVITGHSSDLRTGLPQQMVEIHEPVRLITIINSTKEALISLMEMSQGLAQVFRNQWVRLVCYQDNENAMYLFNQDGTWSLWNSSDEQTLKIGSSSDWCRNEQRNLPFASIIETVKTPRPSYLH